MVHERLNDLTATAQRAAASAPRREQLFLYNLIERFAEIGRLYDSYEAAARTAQAALAENGSLDRNSEAARSLLIEEKKLEREIQVLTLMLDMRVADRVRLAEQREQKSTLVIIALSIFAILLGLTATLLAVRLLRPIHALTMAVQKIESDPGADIRFPMDTDGEIGLLAHALDDMERARKERDRELAEKQEALVRAERLAAIGRISAQITHEIRNPLTSIGLNTEMLEEELSGSESLEEA